MAKSTQSELREQIDYERREAKFAEMRTKTEKEVDAYIQEVVKQNDYKPVSTLPRVDFIARLREVFKK